MHEAIKITNGHTILTDGEGLFFLRDDSSYTYNIVLDTTREAVIDRAGHLDVPVLQNRERLHTVMPYEAIPFLTSIGMRVVVRTRSGASYLLVAEGN